MRISSQLPAVTTLRELQRNFLDINKLYEKLSSGQGLNEASDGPANLVLSERLRSQLSAISQAGENVSRVGNVLSTADAAMGQVGDLLTRGQALAVQAANAQSPEELQAVQGQIDSIVDSVRRIGGNTDFAGQKLTDGAQSFVTANVNTAFSQIDIQKTSANFAPSTVSVAVSAAATQGQASGAIAASQTGDAQIQVTGATGTAVVNIGNGATRADVAAAINTVTGQTGVQADATTGAIQATAVGSANFVDIRSLSGSLTGVSDGRVAGTDVKATVNGVGSPAQGNVITRDGTDFSGRLTLANGSGAGTYTFQVTGGGFHYQAGDGTNPGEAGALGIPSVLPNDLGRSANPGGLGSVTTGGPNSLANNPSGAADVFSAALDDLNRARGNLGAQQKNFFEPISNNLQVTAENLAASDSRIRDTDYAATLAELASAQIRGQAGIFAARQSNLEAGNVLRLLG